MILLLPKSNSFVVEKDGLLILVGLCLYKIVELIKMVQRFVL